MIRERHRRRRWPWIVGGIVLVLLIAAPFAISYASAMLLLVPKHNLNTAAGTVQRIDGSSIVLERMPSTERVGTYGLIYEGGQAMVGPVSSTTATTVTRPISDITGDLEPGTKVSINPSVWQMNPTQALGIDFTEVEVSGELGAMPAWQIEGEGDTWLIFVHGIDGEREGGLRPLPTIVAAGLPTLLITYRNDQGAPASPDGLSHLGQTEWRDLEAAVEYATGEGATKIILYGDSMGGAISTRFIHESDQADLVTAMVLDAPALDWSGIIHGQAEQLNLGMLSGMVQWMVSLRTGVDFADLDELDQTDAFTMPILLFQGKADPLVPPAESKRFADAVGAEFVEVPEAGHIQSWNVDPDAYDDRLAAFLASVTAN